MQNLAVKRISYGVSLKRVQIAHLYRLGQVPSAFRDYLPFCDMGLQ